MTQKILFICEQNQLRSPTAEAICKGMPSIEARSAGLAKSATNPVTPDLIEWADVVVVMERRQRNKLHKLIGTDYATKRIVCFYIPDEYEYMDPALVLLLKERLSRNLGISFDQEKGNTGAAG